MRSLQIMVVLCVLVSSTAFAIKGGNCWDPSTWGHVCNNKTETVSELPVEFLGESKVRENLTTLYEPIGTHVEGYQLDVKKISTDTQTTYLVILRKIVMPPSPTIVSHFTITRRVVDGHPQIDVSDIRSGSCDCDLK